MLNQLQDSIDKLELEKENILFELLEKELKRLPDEDFIFQVEIYHDDEGGSNLSIYFDEDDEEHSDIKIEIYNNITDYFSYFHDIRLIKLFDFEYNEDNILNLEKIKKIIKETNEKN